MLSTVDLFLTYRLIPRTLGSFNDSAQRLDMFALVC